MIGKHRDDLATLFGAIAGIFGAIAGICGVLVANGLINPTIGGSIGGIATVFLGVITNYGVNQGPRIK